MNQARTNVIMGDKTYTLHGKSYIEDRIGNLLYQISPRAFFQVNPVQTEKLYNKALEYAGLTGTETVWDLYCGTGTISLFLAQKARSVRGVEIIPCRGARVSVNGQKAQAGHYALSGALIQAGDTVLRLRLYKRLRLPADSGDMHDSPDPLLNAWDEDDFLPNGMGVPTPLGDEYENDYGTDGDPGPYSDDEPPDAGEWPGPQRGKILHMPRFGDEPPEERE